MKKLLLVAPLALLLIAGMAPAGDFNGDGTDDVAVFRPSTGMWAIRNSGRIYLGAWNDEPVPGDYNGDGTDEVGVYRASTGMWAFNNGVPRVYYGSAGDLPIGGNSGSDGDWYRTGTNLCALAAGNIGIGTGTPASKLDITVGNGEQALIKIEQPGTDNWTGLRLDRDGSEKWFIGMDPVDDGFLLRRGATNDDLFISTGGNVGLGTVNPAYKLDVNGDINTNGDVRKSGVAYNNPDYVFEPDYQFLSLGELKKFIAGNKHLPGMPSTKEVREDGVKIFEQNRLVLEKLEEAYLYILQQNEAISRLEKKVEAMERSVRKSEEPTGNSVSSRQ